MDTIQSTSKQHNTNMLFMDITIPIIILHLDHPVRFNHDTTCAVLVNELNMADSVINVAKSTKMLITNTEQFTNILNLVEENNVPKHG